MRMWGRSLTAATGILAGAVAVAQPPAGQSPANQGVTLRTTTTLVQVNVVARDAKGRPVAGLKKEDFELFDNGKPQEIATFSGQTAAPGPKAAPLAAFPDDRVQPESPRGAHAVVLLDYWNSGLEPSMRARVEVVRMLNQFDPGGAVALYVLDTDGIRLIGNFGTDRKALLDKLASVTGRPNPCNDNALPGETVKLCEPKERYWHLLQRELQTIAAFDYFADQLSFFTGRKALIWTSTGTDVRTDYIEMKLTPPDVGPEIERAIEKLNNADVAIYGVDACGVPIGCKSHRLVLDEFSARTGGIASHHNDIDVAMKDAVEDVSATYSLSFYAPKDGAPNNYHQLKVQVRRPGIQLSYKQGYSLDAPRTAVAASSVGAVPGAEGRSASMARLAGSMALKALETVTAPGTIGAFAQAPFFYASPGTAVVNLAMDVTAAGLKLENMTEAELALVAVAAMPDGKVAARFSDTVKLKAEDLRAVNRGPYHYEHQFRLAPGQYNVRVTFTLANEGFGRVETPITINPWDGKTMTLSGIALAKETRRAPEAIAGLDAGALEGRKALVARGVEIVPAGTLKFKRTGPCHAYVEIYDPALEGANQPKLSLQIRALDALTGESKADSGTFSVDNLARAGNRVIPVVLSVPVASLAPGAYKLEVTATHPAASDSVKRVVNFDVE